MKHNKKYNEMQYNIKFDTIIFFCSTFVLEEDNALTSLINDFLLSISKDHQVFFYGFYPNNEEKLIDTNVILERAESISEPYKRFFHLSEAKVDINPLFDCGCMNTIYYFAEEVKWADFLAASVIEQPINLIKKGKLSAFFSISNHGGDYWLVCSKAYEEKVMQLFESISDLGYEVKHSFGLQYEK